MSSQRCALVLINPRAGAGKDELVLQTLSTIFAQHGWSLVWQELIEPIALDAIMSRLRSASDHDISLVIAAGGDGTASLVGHAIVDANLGARIGLGLFPSGTANTLAHELGIPADWSVAAHFLATHEPALLIDAMHVDDRYYFLRIGVGLDAETIRETKQLEKRRFGRWAYLKSFLQSMRTPHRHRFYCQIDGKNHRFYAVQLFIANGGGLALAPFRLGPQISLADGHVNVCGYDALTRWDYGRLVWNLIERRYQRQPKMKFWLAHHSILVKTHRPLAVQADGEWIGNTPVRIQIVPRALRVISSR
jgi:diacylglycerol kinase family enzyme